MEIQLINGDSLKALKEYGNNHFDIAIVDPPYGKLISFYTKRSLKSYDNVEPSKEYYNELMRVSINQIIWGVNYLQNIHLTGGRIIWNKLGMITNYRKQAPTLSDAEIAYCSIKKQCKIFSYAWIGNVIGNNYQINSHESKQRFHPNQKPIALYKWLLKNYTNEDDLILDTHLGSGSIAIACHQMKRKLIAYEIDSQYYEKACKWFKAETAQQVLW